MKKSITVLGLTLLLAACHPGIGTTMRPIQQDLNSDLARQKLNPTIALSFSQGAVPGQNLGTYVSNKKTNSTNKDAPEACRIAFISALISLQNRAAQLGGNAVVNIHSYYNKNPVYNASSYQCEDGFWMTGVALRGTVVRR